MDRKTEELPGGSGEREPTLPLPEASPASRRPAIARRLREPRVVWSALAAAALAGSFFAGWALGSNERSERPVPRVEAAPPPTRDARYCGRALDTAARVVQLYRTAVDNRIAAAEAAVDRDLDRMRELDRVLPALTAAADRLEARMTRALATCPS